MPAFHGSTCASLYLLRVDPALDLYSSSANTSETLVDATARRYPIAYGARPNSFEDSILLVKSIIYRYFMEVMSKIDSIAAKDLIETLASKGRYSFTSQEARNRLKVSPDASKLALNRLTKQGLIATPARGFYVIIPPEYRSLGCLPAEQFIPDLMKLKELNYYAGLLTAAQYYGAAHQRPQEFQIFVQKNRRPIRCGKIRVRFIARKNINDVPVRTFNTSRGALKVSTPEATAIDLAGYPEHVGGLDQVATILSELAGEIDASALVEAATTAPITWVQRLGYILELVEAANVTASLKEYVDQHAREYTMLIPGGSNEGEPRLRDWKLVVNAKLEPDI